jgi:hypothetical protein
MVTVNRVKDFIERVAWTAIAGAAAAALATGFDNWNLTAKVAGIAALTSALKVIVAQNVGTHNDGAAIPGGVIETKGV